jgi:hypothetical protein
MMAISRSACSRWIFLFNYWFLGDSGVLASLNGKIPWLYVTREEWGPLASKWAEANSPAAKVISFGKHMMKEGVLDSTFALHEKTDPGADKQDGRAP